MRADRLNSHAAPQPKATHGADRPLIVCGKCLAIHLRVETPDGGIVIGAIAREGRLGVAPVRCGKAIESLLSLGIGRRPPAKWFFGKNRQGRDRQRFRLVAVVLADAVADVDAQQRDRPGDERSPVGRQDGFEPGPAARFSRNGIGHGLLSFGGVQSGRETGEQINEFAI